MSSLGIQNFSSVSQFDILVVGAGLAGIKAAVTCANSNQSVLLVTTSSLCSGSSFYPLMDTIHCLCTSDKADEEDFFKDIESCSYGMNDPYMAKYYITHIKSAIKELPQIGITYEKLPEKKLACFGHTERDLYYWKDWVKLRKQVSDCLSSYNNLTVWESTDLTAILTCPVVSPSIVNKSEKKVCGAVFLKKNQLVTISVKALILASGGFGNIYLHNLNTSDVNGSSHVLALLAGASLINLEFNQFIPGFLHPVYKTVFREGTLKYCSGLLDHEGNNSLKSLLPNDSSYKKCLNLREPHGPFTSSDDSKYFDIALMKSVLKNLNLNGGAFTQDIGCQIQYSSDIKEDNRIHLQDYLKWMTEDLHVDLAADSIFIAPFFHAANGGIQVNQRCKTQVDGLYACGESAGGIHGADRLGGMASGSCFVFGKLAAESAIQYAKSQDLFTLSKEQAKEQFIRTYTPVHSEKIFSFKKQNGMTPKTIIIRIQQLMWQYGNILRSHEEIQKALSEIQLLSNTLAEISPPETCITISNKADYYKACQFLILSKAMLTAMDQRKESRGAHYRQDYPFRDDKNFNYRISIRKIGNNLEYSKNHP